MESCIRYGIPRLCVVVDTVFFKSKCCGVTETLGVYCCPDTKMFAHLDRGRTNSTTYRQQGQLLFHRETTK